MREVSLVIGAFWLLSTSACVESSAAGDADPILTSRPTARAALAGGTCALATHEVDTLPFLHASFTTGETDDYDIDADGTCAAGGQFQWTGSGTGPDLVYRIRTNSDCRLEVEMTTVTADMNITVVTDCANLAATCLGMSDFAFGGETETITFLASAETDYFIIVDGYDGDFGNFNIVIDEPGSINHCDLVAAPVVCDGFNEGQRCSDGSQCTADICTTGLCVSTNDDTLPCSDGNPCTDDVCSAGTCVATPNDSNSCSDSDGCTVESCNAGACESTSNPACADCIVSFWQQGPLPIVIPGDTTNAADSFNIRNQGSCAGGGLLATGAGDGPDDVYRLRVDFTCDILVEADVNASHALYLVTDCGDLSGSCLDSDSSTVGNPVDLSFTAQAGVDYFLILDGMRGDAGTYELHLSEITATGCTLIVPIVVCDGSNDGEICDDGKPCTEFGQCTAGICAASANDALSCADSNPCTTDSCVAGACISVNDDTNTCDDGNRCSDDSCVAGVCASVNNDTNTCSDRVLCTDDACVAGACVGTPTDCSALDRDCRAGFCNATTGFCESAPSSGGGGCDDGDPCTISDICTAGLCTGLPMDCSSLDGVCQMGVCNGTTGLCEPGPLDCSALDDVCQVGVCNGGTGLCETAPAIDGQSCDDSDPCTDTDRCTAGVCVGVAKDCDDACNTGSCDAISGACVKSAANDGGPCDDNDACTDSDVCAAGDCVGLAIDCTLLDDACNTGACNSTNDQCEPLPTREALNCDDGDPCTKLDRCATGSCAGVAKDCSAFIDECNTGLCDPVQGSCHAAPLVDGSACTTNDGCGGSCQAGMCEMSADCSTGDGGPSGGDPGPAEVPPIGCGCGVASASPGAAIWSLLLALVTLRPRRRSRRLTARRRG